MAYPSFIFLVANSPLLTVHVNGSLQVHLKVLGTSDDVSLAHVTVVLKQPGPAVSTEEVSSGTMVDFVVPGVSDITHLRTES